MATPLTIDQVVDKTYERMSGVFEKKTAEMVAEVHKQAAEREAALRKEYDEKLAEQRTDYMGRLAAGKQGGGDAPKGLDVARYVRAIAAAKGDIDRAARFAKQVWGEEASVTRALSEKALGSSDLASGGALVPEAFSTDLIDVLRPMSVVRASNPIVYPMPNGTLTVPKLTSGSTASYVGESTAQNATQPGTGQLRLVWKKLRALVPLSNELIRFSSPAADQTVLRDLARAMSQAADVAFIRGDGLSDQPRGMRYQAAAANITASNAANDASVPTLAEVEQDLRQLLQALEGANVTVDSANWFMAPRTKNFLLTLRDTVGFLAFPEVREGRLWGFPLRVTGNIPTNLGAGTDGESEIYLANMNDCVIGEATQIEVDISNEASYTDSSGTVRGAFDRDETVIRTIERHDFGVRHDASIAVKTGVVYGAH